MANYTIPKQLTLNLKGSDSVMESLKFVVPGEPRGKGRPRFRNLGKFVQTYTDKETVMYENLVKMSYVTEYGNTIYNNGEQLKVVIKSFQSIPKSESKKKRELMLSGKLRPTKKPDADNICKSVLDGLNKAAYLDDTQVVELVCEKYYSDSPRVEVEICQL